MAVQVADDVFDHHHRAIHHHAEIQRAQREQVRGNVPQVETNRGKKQRERNRQRDDERAADIAQENEKDDHDENHSFGEIVQHRVRRVMHQIVAIQVGNDLHARGQDVIIQLLHHGVNALHRRRRVRAFAHEHDAFHDVVVVNHHAVGAMNGLSDLPQANLRPLRRPPQYP